MKKCEIDNTLKFECVQCHQDKTIVNDRYIITSPINMSIKQYRSNNNSANELSKLLDSFKNTLHQIVTEYKLSHTNVIELVNSYIHDFSIDLPDYKVISSLNGVTTIKIHKSFHEYLSKNNYSVNDIRNMVLYIESYGAYILANYPKLKEVLYIYELQDMETLACHVRRVLEYERFLENIRINKEYIKKTVSTNTYFHGSQKAYVGLLYLPHVEFIMVISNYTLESIKEICEYNQEEDIKTSLESEKQYILSHIPSHRKDVYDDIITTFNELYKKEWFKRKGPFFDIFEIYPNTDPGLWNSQIFYDSLGIQYLIAKAYEQDCKPITDFDKHTLNMTYLRFGIVCAFLNSDDIGILDVPYYCDYQYLKEKNISIITKFTL